MLDEGEASDIEQRIAELKSRWPAHSVPPAMWDELEELEEELRKTQEAGNEGNDGGEAGAG